MPAAIGDEFSSQCFELGSCGVQHEERADGGSLFTVYFESDQSIDTIRSELTLFIESKADRTVHGEFEIDIEEERDWSTQWRDFLKPMQVTDRIRITQPWNTLHPPSAGGFEIVIEPKMAFGSGGHESTRLCLMALEAADPLGASFLDVGTGSGVLAIAATFLGAREVTAIDDDVVATDNAKENVTLNLGGGIALEKRVQVLEGSVEAVEGCQYDMIVANIESQHLYPLLEPIERLLAADGVAVFSGLITRERQCFCEQLHRVGLRPMGEQELNGWMCFTAQRT